MAEKDELVDAVSDAFPGAALRIDTDGGLFSITLQMEAMRRPFEGAELSDGTLQYLCMLAALLTPRPPNFMVLNEPETSIHPDLYQPLAKLIVNASKKCQMVVTTHARDLAGYLKKGGANLVEFEKIDGETKIVGERLSPDDDEDE
jgi:predicted ATPase